jgi:hypothetical protein
MTNQQKNFATRAKSLILPSEPYEMTYWKKKLNTPFKRFVAAAKAWHEIRVHPFAYAK